MTNVFGTASTWAKLALLLIVVAAALHVAGFATNYWMLTETIQENLAFATGLWKAINCSGGHDSACADMDVRSEHKTVSFKAVQAFESIVLVLVVVGAIIAAMYVASERFREMSIAITITILCFVAVTLGLIAMIIWLVLVASDYYPGYSIGLCVTAFLMCFLAGVLMILDIRRYQGNSGKIRRVRPEERTEANTYDKFRDHQRSDYSFNRKFASPPPETPVTNIRQYYNPNREPYVRSPPPSYQTAWASVNSRSVRTDIQTPDVYLGRDGRKHTRY